MRGRILKWTISSVMRQSLKVLSPFREKKKKTGKANWEEKKKNKVNSQNRSFPCTLKTLNEAKIFTTLPLANTTSQHFLQIEPVPREKKEVKKRSFWEGKQNSLLRSPVENGNWEFQVGMSICKSTCALGERLSRNWCPLQPYLITFYLLYFGLRNTKINISSSIRECKYSQTFHMLCTHYCRYLELFSRLFV